MHDSRSPPCDSVHPESDVIIYHTASMRVETGPIIRPGGTPRFGNPKRTRGSRWCGCLCVLLVGLALPGRAEPVRILPLGSGHEIHFLSGPEAQAAITEDEHDPFFGRLTALDAQLRLGGRLDDPSPARRIEAVKAKCRQAVRNWTDEEVAAVAQACRSIFPRAERISPQLLPNPWRFVTTDGSEEFGAAYTRHDAIILPAQRIRTTPPPELARLVAHETAHVISRTRPALRDRLYQRLGFRRTGPIELGPYLEGRRITNPDGPSFEHVIRVRLDPLGEVDAVLVTYTKDAQLDPAASRDLLAFLRYGLFAVEPVGAASAGPLRVQHRGEEPPAAYTPDRAGGFFEQTGRNTRYLIHPDEILADNIALLLTLDLDAPQPAGRYDLPLLRDLAGILVVPVWQPTPGSATKP